MTKPTFTECRPEVQKFACLMEIKLRQNDDKGGWKDKSTNTLVLRVYDEVQELREAISDSSAALSLEEVIANVEFEAADVANFVMMLADNFRESRK